jgi:hypothetical protein
VTSNIIRANNIRFLPPVSLKGSTRLCDGIFDAGKVPFRGFRGKGLGVILQAAVKMFS